MPQDDTGVVLLAAAPRHLLLLAGAGGVIADYGVCADGDAVSAAVDLGNGQLLPLLRPLSVEMDAPMFALVPLGIEGLDRIEAVERLLASLHGRAVPPDTRLTRQQRARLRRMLQCFDGDRAGATQQEIAQILFHIGRLSRHEWQVSSARHAVKALLRDARAMIAGGYRKLLRHRRPS